MQRSTGRGILHGIALAFVLALTVDVARAADVEEPETLIQQAVELRRKGDNARAYGYLRRAYDLARTPRSAAQLGLVEHALGRYAEAEVHLGEALASSDPWVATNRSRLESSRTFVRSKLGRVEIVGAPADASVAVDMDPPVKVPRDRTFHLAPGERTLRVEAPGISPVTKTVAVSAGQTATVTIEAVAAKEAEPSRAGRSGTAAAEPSGDPSGPAAARPAAEVRESAGASTDPGSGRAWRITGIGLAGGGLALGVAGIFVRGAATSKLDAIASDARNGRPYDESNGNWQDLERAGVAMIVTGGAAVLAGTVLYLVNRTSPESSRVALGFAPAIGGGGALTFAGQY